MPSFPPRSTPAKKSDQLFIAVSLLVLGLQRRKPRERLLKMAGEVKKAELSYLKARLALLTTQRLNQEPDTVAIAEVSQLMEIMEAKSPEQVLEAYRETYVEEE